MKSKKEKLRKAKVKITEIDFKFCSEHELVQSKTKQKRFKKLKNIFIQQWIKNYYVDDNEDEN